jgi:hypothetical protein
MAGKSWNPPRSEAGWPCRRGKEEKEIQRAVEKAAGDESAFIPEQSCGLAVGRAPTPCRMRRAVGGVRGPAKLDPVIHRYGVNQKFRIVSTAGGKYAEAKIRSPTNGVSWQTRNVRHARPAQGSDRPGAYFLSPLDLEVSSPSLPP